jgi:hypothetical protein
MNNARISSLEQNPLSSTAAPHGGLKRNHIAASFAARLSGLTRLLKVPLIVRAAAECVRDRKK